MLDIINMKSTKKEISNMTSCHLPNRTMINNSWYQEGNKEIYQTLLMTSN